MEKYNGKVIYNPSGKAGEYSVWDKSIIAIGFTITGHDEREMLIG